MLEMQPVAVLAIHKDLKNPSSEGTGEPVHGGYSNARGEVFLFSEDLVYRVNFKNQTLQQRPPLNSGAQMRYDETEAGSEFQFANKTFRRLSNEQIVEICSSGRFRITSRFM